MTNELLPCIIRFQMNELINTVLPRRGMFSLATHTPMIGETINIPTLELTGKAAQRFQFQFHMIEIHYIQFLIPATNYKENFTEN